MSDFTMKRGDSKVFNLTISGDITGAKLWMSAKTAYNSTSFVFQKDTALLGGIVITNGPGGLATVTLDPTDTSSLPPITMKLVYDVQVKSAGGLVSTVQSGTLTVEPDVTIATS